MDSVAKFIPLIRSSAFWEKRVNMILFSQGFEIGTYAIVNAGNGEEKQAKMRSTVGNGRFK